MKVITIGKRLVPAEQIAFVEVFDAARNPEFKPDKEFKGRVVLLNRDTVLSEMAPQEFAAMHGLRLFAEDNIAVGESIAFRVEIFTPTENFRPSKAYQTRLKWSDQDGNEQSKLLIAAPEAVVAELSLRRTEPTESPTGPPRRPSRARRGSRKIEAARG